MTRGGRVLPLLLAAILAAAVGLAFQKTDWLRGPEQRTIDTRYDLRGEQEPRGDVVIVGIDDEALGNGPFPFDRRRHARVVDQLTEAGAAVIAFDIQFTQPSQTPAPTRRCSRP